MTQSFTQIAVNTIQGQPTSLAEHAGKVLLVVNVASKCGLTPQYDGLQALHEAKSDSGFSVLGFPANDFAGQEPRSNEEIAEFCTTNFSVTFPTHEKLVATGPDKHPLYAALISGYPSTDNEADSAAFREKLRGFGMTPTEAPEILWNFEKFLIGRNGSIAGRFAPTTTADDPALLAAIDAEIAK